MIKSDFLCESGKKVMFPLKTNFSRSLFSLRKRYIIIPHIWVEGYINFLPRVRKLQRINTSIKFHRDLLLQMERCTLSLEQFEQGEFCPSGFCLQVHDICQQISFQGLTTHVPRSTGSGHRRDFIFPSYLTMLRRGKVYRAPLVDGCFSPEQAFCLLRRSSNELWTS